VSRTKNKRRNLFDAGEKPRRSPRRMMHVIDASGDCSDPGSHSVVFQCSKCDHKTGWLKVDSVSEGKRGIPCPICNREKHDDTRR
jgi:DNA-directed RNA polymerase subunit RPC12/RpoP